MYEINVVLVSQTFYMLYRGRITYEKHFVSCSAAFNANAVSKMLVLLTVVKIVESTHLCCHEVISVVTTNCCRNGKKSRHGVCILFNEVGCEYVVIG